jgi:hypothetical protein
MTTISERQTSKPIARGQAVVATGVAAAAMIAGGIGTFVLGLLTTGAEASEGLANALNWWNPVGPLSGKTGLAVIVWLISWYVLDRVWHNENRRLQQAFTITLILIGLGLLLTFPPFFELFK